MTITILYAGILSILYGILAIAIVSVRNQARHLYTASETDNILLKRLIRGHGNFGEYVPYIVFMMALIESRGAHPWILHALGAALVLGRVTHAYAFSRDHEVLICRIVGTATTISILFICGIYCIVLGLS